MIKIKKHRRVVDNFDGNVTNLQQNTVNGI